MFCSRNLFANIDGKQKIVVHIFFFYICIENEKRNILTSKLLPQVIQGLNKTH